MLSTAPDLSAGRQRRWHTSGVTSGSDSYDAVIVGGGHNGLVAATLLARAGTSVAVFERQSDVGGAAVSANVFPGTGARLSRYAYLVSLFPRWLLDLLGVELELRRRPVSSYTPVGDSGILDRDGVGIALLGGLSEHLYPTLGEPLRSTADIRSLIGTEPFRALCERPLSELIEATFEDDVTRGIVATDALIGTFAPMDDSQLRQNRCFLYHVIGGSWDVPVGGMGALSEGLTAAALAAGAEIRASTPVASIDADAPGGPMLVRLHDGRELRAGHVLANVAPSVLRRLLGDGGRLLGDGGRLLGDGGRLLDHRGRLPGDGGDPEPEGSQLKLNMVLSRLPRLRDPSVDPAEAFGGTFHVNESYSQLNAAYVQAAAGEIPDPVPCEAYCHSLTDPSILPSELRRRGVVTLTVFALHMPARLFRGQRADGTAIDHDAVKDAAIQATLSSMNSVLGEPLEDCLLIDPSTGRACLEAHTPIELEAELGLPAGHIFHGDLSWPWAETPDAIGRWGVETERPNLWICGSGAHRGGGVSGIPGHNAARAVLEQLSGG
jgi:phytoene dehydrogenase-like protein